MISFEFCFYRRQMQALRNILFVSLTAIAATVIQSKPIFAQTVGAFGIESVTYETMSEKTYKAPSPADIGNKPWFVFGNANRQSVDFDDGLFKQDQKRNIGILGIGKNFNNGMTLSFSAFGGDIKEDIEDVTDTAETGKFEGTIVGGGVYLGVRHEENWLFDGLIIVGNTDGDFRSSTGTVDDDVFFHSATLGIHYTRVINELDYAVEVSGTYRLENETEEDPQFGSTDSQDLIVYLQGLGVVGYKVGMIRPYLQAGLVLTPVEDTSDEAELDAEVFGIVGGGVEFLASKRLVFSLEGTYAIALDNASAYDMSASFMYRF